MRSSIIAISALLISSASASPLLSRASNELVERDFFCDVKNVQCCDQMMTKADAAKSFGNLFALPDGLVGGVGLGCRVSPRICHTD